MWGGGRHLSGRRPDPVRSTFETIKTADNLGKPLRDQILRCKACMEQVVGRPERLKDHKAKCFAPQTQDQVC